MNVFLIVFFVFLIICIIRYIKLKKNASSLPLGVVHMYSGTIGSGKTSTAVINDLIPYYNRLNLRYKIFSKFPFLAKILKKEIKRPVIYSNIPVNISGNPKKPFMSEVLTRDCLLLRDKFPADVVPLTLIDETGIVANQYSFDDPQICGKNIVDDFKTFENFIRFYRHLYGDESRLILTDQSVGDLNISLRRRISRIYWLENRRKVWLAPPRTYKIDVRELLLVEDGVQNANPLLPSEDEEKNAPYLLTKMPKKRYKFYDTRCYRDLYNADKPLLTLKGQWPESVLTTSYILDISSTRKDRLYRKVQNKLDNCLVDDMTREARRTAGKGRA